MHGIPRPRDWLLNIFVPFLLSLDPKAFATAPVTLSDCLLICCVVQSKLPAVKACCCSPLWWQDYGLFYVRALPSLVTMAETGAGHLGSYWGYCRVTRLSYWACSAHCFRLPSPRTTHILRDRRATCVSEAESWKPCVKPLHYAASSLSSEPPPRPLFIYHFETGSWHLIQADLEQRSWLMESQACAVILRGSVFLADA